MAIRLSQHMPTALTSLCRRRKVIISVALPNTRPRTTWRRAAPVPLPRTAAASNAASRGWGGAHRYASGMYPIPDATPGLPTSARRHAFAADWASPVQAGHPPTASSGYFDGCRDFAPGCLGLQGLARALRRLVMGGWRRRRKLFGRARPRLRPGALASVGLARALRRPRGPGAGGS